MRRLVLLAVLAVARPAGAINCDQLTNPVYLQVGDTQLNLMKRLGRALRDNLTHPITLVFVTSGSCTNIANFYAGAPGAGGTPVPVTTNMQYVPSTMEDSNWNPAASPTLQCTQPTTAGTLVDIANSALFISSCTTATPPTTVHFTNGPVQAYVMAAPRASSQTAITFEEAYFVFGFGTAGMVMPWVDETQMFIRTITKSTLLTWAANIAVPGDKWHGTRFDGSPMVLSALQTSTAPEAAIGILGAEVYDANRATLKELAFRAKDQYAAYFADSTSTSRDKKNVRDGHYTVWSPTVWMDYVDGNNNPIKPDAQYVIDMIAGHPVTPALMFDPDTIVAAVGLVPDCAMRVQRSFDGGPLSLYTPQTSCTCKFESSVDVSTCATCSASTPCASGVCRSGYCEAF